MGIFDDIVTGINKEIGRVQAKSQEMMQTYQLNAQIRELEGKITAHFIEIGRLMYDQYERNKEVSEETLRAKTAEISEWEREITVLKAELEAVRAQYDPDVSASRKADAKAGYTHTPGFQCPHCQAPANSEKTFCPACGGDLKESTPGAKSGGDNGSGAEETAD